MNRPGQTWGNLALAFTLELCGLAAFGYWGCTCRQPAADPSSARVRRPHRRGGAVGPSSPLRAPVASPVAAAAVQIAFHFGAALALGATASASSLTGPAGPATRGWAPHLNDGEPVNQGIRVGGVGAMVVSGISG